MAEVNLDRIQSWIDAGRLDPTKQITPVEPIKSKCVSKVKDGIKLLARGKTGLTTPIDIVVSRASASAIQSVEAAGGKIMTRFYTKESLHRLVAGQSTHTTTPLPYGAEHVDVVLEEARSGPHMYRLPDPTSRWDTEYYRDPAHRGYLSHTLKPGESPSLFFKVPGAKKEVDLKAEAKKKKTAGGGRQAVLSSMYTQEDGVLYIVKIDVHYNAAARHGMDSGSRYLHPYA